MQYLILYYSHERYSPWQHRLATASGRIYIRTQLVEAADLAAALEQANIHPLENGVLSTIEARAPRLPDA